MIVYCCPKCKMTDIGEENEQKNCMRCGIPMISLGISSSEWNKMNNDQMKEAVNSCIQNNEVEPSEQAERINIESEQSETDESVESYEEEVTTIEETEDEVEDYASQEQTPVVEVVSDEEPVTNKAVVKKTVQGSNNKVSRTNRTLETSGIPQSTVEDNNGRFTKLSIAALVCSILGCVSVVGIILGVVDLIQGYQTGDGRRKGLSIAAIAVGAAFIVIGFVSIVGSGASKYVEKSNEAKALMEQTASAPTETPTPTPEPTDTPTPTPEPTEVVEEPVDENEALKKELDENYGIDKPREFARGDKTGKWKIVKVANTTPPADYAVEYARAYMQDADMTSLHYIVNFTLRTTTKLQKIDNTLIVTTTEYVDKEEHDATIIGEGMEYSEECYNMETGEEIKAEVDSNAEPVSKDELISAVKDAISGSVGEGEKIKSVDFDGKDLIVTVDMSEAVLPFDGITTKDIAETRIDSITQSILDLDDSYYNTWETVTLDFGNDGKATFNKNQVKDQGLGKYFDYPLDVLK